MIGEKKGQLRVISSLDKTHRLRGKAGIEFNRGVRVCGEAS
jgi:hypothetical protein